MRKTRLKDVVSTQSGPYLQTDPGGDAIYVQARDFKEDGGLVGGLHPNLAIDEKRQGYLLREGDVLFAAKGVKNFAVVYTSEMGSMVASSTFFVLRVREQARDLLLPEFLAWVINNPVAQRTLKAAAIGSALPSINKPVIEDLEISIPSIQRQHQIIKIHSLRIREKEIVRQIGNLRDLYIQTLLLNSTQAK